MATSKKPKVASNDAAIDVLVNHFKSNRYLFEGLAEGLSRDLQLNPALKPLIHSIGPRTLITFATSLYGNVLKPSRQGRRSISRRQTCLRS